MTNLLFLSFTRFLISEIAPWVATGLLCTLVGIAFSYIHTARKRFNGFKTEIKIGFLLCMVIGALIRFAWVPSGHRIFFDEDRYLSYAVNFARHGKAVGLVVATPEKVFLGDPDPAARITVPVLNAWTLRVFGYSEDNLFLMARLWSVIQIGIIFIAAYLLFHDEYVALFSAFVFAFSPISVYWSVSTNIDVYFVTFSLLSLIASAMYARAHTLRTLLFVWATVTLLLMVRFESFLVLPSLLFTIASVRERFKTRIFQRADLILISVLLPIIIVRGLVSLPVFNKIWCCAEATPLEIFTTSYVLRNTIPNSLTFFNRPEFPALLSLLAVFALFSSSKTLSWYQKGIFISWLTFFFGIYSFYYAGQYYSYTFSGSYGRFFLMQTVPITLLAGTTLRTGAQIFAKSTFKKRNWMLLAFLLAMLTVFPTIIHYRRLISTSPWDRIVEAGPRTLHAYIDDVMIPKTPPESAIIFGILAPIHLHGKTAIYTDEFLQNVKVQDFIEEYLQSGKPVFSFETHTCDIYPEQCTEVLKRFTFEPYLPTTDPKYPGLEMKQVRLKQS